MKSFRIELEFLVLSVRPIVAGFRKEPGLAWPPLGAACNLHPLACADCVAIYGACPLGQKEKRICRKDESPSRARLWNGSDPCSSATYSIESTPILGTYFARLFFKQHSFSVKKGRMTQLEAKAYFSLMSYITQSLFIAVAMGLMTTPVVMLFLKPRA